MNETNVRTAIRSDYYKHLEEYVMCTAHSANCIANGGWACIPKAMRYTCNYTDLSLCLHIGDCTCICCGGIFIRLLLISLLKITST